MLLTHVDYVKEPVCAFARLLKPIKTEVEQFAPVRYVFILLGPKTEQLSSSNSALPSRPALRTPTL